MKNLVVLAGRIGSNPETKHIASGTNVTTLRLVTSSPKFAEGKVVKDPVTGYTETYDQWHTIVMFNGLGDNVAKHKTKGDMLLVQGRIQYGKYTDKDNIERYTTEIIADDVTFV